MLPLSLRRTALAAVLGTALTTGQLLADEPLKPTTDVATKSDFKTLQETLDAIRKEIAELKTKDVAEIRKDVADLKSKDLSKDVTDVRKEMTDLKAKEVAEFRKELDALREFKKQTQTTLEGGDKGSADGLVKKINNLDDKLTALEKQLTSIDNKLSESVRVALKATDPEKSAEKKAEKAGSVKIVNMYSTPIDVLINGKGYTVKSNESKEVPMTVGTFTYQLLTSGGEETKRAIKDGEVVTLLVK
jgi:polyhydroxyalkanoate synthesis regulator phasin